MHLEPPRTYRAAHVRPVLGLELQCDDNTDTCREELQYPLLNPKQGRVAGIVHVEVHDWTDETMQMRCAEYGFRLAFHLHRMQLVGIDEMPVPTYQLLVHTGHGPLPRVHTVRTVRRTDAVTMRCRS